jgi:hypothetical protein
MYRHDVGQRLSGSGSSFSFPISSPPAGGPNTISQPVANPTVNLLEFDLDTCQSEVVEPALLSDFQLPYAFRKRFRSSFPGNGFEVLFERFPALVANH